MPDAPVIVNNTPRRTSRRASYSHRHENPKNLVDAHVRRTRWVRRTSFRFSFCVLR